MMVAGELINSLIPPLKPTDAVSKVIMWMEELRVNQLPVIEEGKFIGLISEDIILDANDLDRDVQSFRLACENCYVSESQHLFDVLKTATDHGVDIVAVLDHEGAFEGVVTVQDTIRAFAQSAAVQSPGAILVLAMKQLDYSLSEIARLVESNDAQVLSSSVAADVNDAERIRVTIKVSSTDVSRIAATFERFGYAVIGNFQEAAMLSNDKERIDILLKYLDI